MDCAITVRVMCGALGMRRFFLSFVRGYGQIFNFSRILNKREHYKSISPEERDYNALRSDWEAVGRDLRWAMETYHADKK